MTKENLESWKTDELTAELDRRLEEQGFDPKVGGIQVTMDYLREGWSVIAVPPEIADRVVDTAVTPTTLAMLSGELKRVIAEHSASTPCERCHGSGNDNRDDASLLKCRVCHPEEFAAETAALRRG